MTLVKQPWKGGQFTTNIKSACVDLMRNGIFSDYATNINLLTDEKAVFIMANLFDIAESRQEILRSFSLELEDVLPAKKVFRYMLIENNISIGQIYSLAKKLPLP